MKNYKVITPLFPTYAQIQAMMKAVSGYSVNSVSNMINAIQEQTGTPQNPVDWSEPDMWINERLKGEDAEIALRIWNQDNHILNPRHSYGSYLFLNSSVFELMETTPKDTWVPTESGQQFLNNDDATLRTLDDKEGLLHLLELLADVKCPVVLTYSRNGRLFYTSIQNSLLPAPSKARSTRASIT